MSSESEYVLQRTPILSSQWKVCYFTRHFLIWSIYRLLDPNKLYYFTVEITRETILEV